MVKAEGSPNPLLRVSRPVSACQRCRGAKIKCDGQLPTCTACRRVGKGDECSNANDPFAKGKERSYVASLELRIGKLERQISQAQDRKARIDILNVTSAAGFVQAGLHASTGTRKSDRQEASDVDDLVSDFGFLSVNATARDFHGFAGEMSFAKLVLSTSSLNPLPKNITPTLPPRYEITPVIQHYLDNIHTVYPILSETGLFTSIDAMYGHGGLYANPADRWLTWMVLAVSCASLVQEKGDIHYHKALNHAAAALNYTESVIQPGAISGVQATLLMVLLAMWLPHYYNSWYLVGVASRAAVDLGLHQKPSIELQLKDSEIATRLRVFNCAYSLDRSISMVNQRAFSFTDDSINVNTYLVDLQGAPPSQALFTRSLEPAIQLVKLRQFQSCAYQKIFQGERLPIHALYNTIYDAIQDMEKWYSNLKPQISQAMRHHAYCEVLFSNVLMLTPPNWVDELPEQGRILVFQYAQEYAERLNHSINDGQGNVGFYTSHDLLRVSFVAQRFLVLLEKDYTLLIPGLVLSQPPRAQDLDIHPVAETGWSLPSHGSDADSDSDKKLRRTYDCLEYYERAIGYFGSKYGYEGPLHEYRKGCSSLRHTLGDSRRPSTQAKGVNYS